MQYLCTAMDDVGGESIRVPGVLSVVIEAETREAALARAVKSFANVGHDFIAVKEWESAREHNVKIER